MRSLGCWVLFSIPMGAGWSLLYVVGIVFDTCELTKRLSVESHSSCVPGIVFDTYGGGVEFSLCCGYRFRYPCLRGVCVSCGVGIVFDTYEGGVEFTLCCGYRFQYLSLRGSRNKNPPFGADFYLYNSFRLWNKV